MTLKPHLTTVNCPCFRFHLIAESSPSENYQSIICNHLSCVDGGWSRFKLRCRQATGFYHSFVSRSLQGQKIIHANNYTFRHLEWPFYLTYMCLDYGRKQEHLKGSWGKLYDSKKKKLFIFREQLNYFFNWFRHISYLHF